MNQIIILLFFQLWMGWRKPVNESNHHTLVSAAVHGLKKASEWIKSSYSCFVSCAWAKESQWMNQIIILLFPQLWMGTHPNGPSIVKIPGEEDVPLSEWVKQHPKQLGSEVLKYFKGSLPFLFKVLSVRTALSIQAHPNKVCKALGEISKCL